MPDLPPVLIVCTTYFPPDERGLVRFDVARRTIASWRYRLGYAGEVILHIADDGSPDEMVVALQAAARADQWERIRCTAQARRGVGASLNEGFGAAAFSGAVVLHAVDDWMLTQDFDITPWVRLMLDDVSVGAVRLGPPHPGITGTVEMHAHGWALRLDRHNIVASQRPTLFHPRFWETYGAWPEDCSALECERLYNERFCRMTGPDILLALLHPWEPIYSSELSAIDPSRGE